MPATRTKRQPAQTTQPVTWERNGKTYEMFEPDAEPTVRQMLAIARLLHRNPELKAPRFPRTKAEASTAISALKKKV